jgi:hypothetical protein
MTDNPSGPQGVRPPVRVRVRTRSAANPNEAPERRIAVAPTGAPRRSPNSGSFAAGKSGNPKGRPKGAKGVKPMVRKVLSAKTKVRDASGTHKVTILQALFHKELELAINGDWRARKTIMDLGRWALPEEAPASEASLPRETTATDAAILDWFAGEVRSRDEGDR